jgi:hypothetical protein
MACMHVLVNSHFTENPSTWSWLTPSFRDGVLQVPSLVSFTSEPCHFDLTHDFVYPSCSTYIRGCYSRSHQWLPWFRSSCTNGRCRPRPRNWSRFFSILIVRSRKVAWMTEKIFPFRLSLYRYPSCYSVNTSFIISYTPPSKSRDRLLLRGEGCNTM